MSEPESSKTDWSLSSGHGYILNRTRTRTHIASCRLNLQHYLWKEALGFNIHPSIRPHLPKDVKIADVATGTATWLLDVGREFPDGKLVGFDKDVKQAPNEKWLPGNTEVRKWYIFEDIPGEWVGMFDFVHVRLLVLVLDGESQILEFVGKLMRMLKPGGYLQWDELDCVNMHVKTPSSSIQAPALQQIRTMSWANGRYDWTRRIPSFLKDVGFEEIDLQNFGDEDRLVRAFNEQHLLTMEEFADSLMRIRKGEAAEMWWELIERGQREAEEGNTLCIPRVVCRGKKPGERGI
ncbi:hypothetical protein BCON_0107g00330 [Botryotinia convoluta]|uniref:Methyltransferase domain-containing protein n=1 Tax=Botryotinia convoluta TaxID=54673 RepID=A0A4Z1I6J2_9HELO|nr:hypothetical protein BCON_0107g00330 [Botryotinia convoluta]